MSDGYPVGGLGEASDVWQAAGDSAGQWLEDDQSSFESAFLTGHARKLLQAIIFELGLVYSSRATAIEECRNFLGIEESTPGSVTARLRLSEDSRIVSCAHDVEVAGRNWVATIGPSRNLVVMTALLNLPTE
jgi:hypothetical protein